jgi:hypothetical protein
MKLWTSMRKTVCCGLAGLGLTLALAPAKATETVQLEDRGKLLLDLELGAAAGKTMLSGSYVVRSRRNECRGTLQATAESSPRELVLAQTPTSGDCESDCSLVLSADLKRYEARCGGRVLKRSRFDKVEGAEALRRHMADFAGSAGAAGAAGVVSGPTAERVAAPATAPQASVSPAPNRPAPDPSRFKTNAHKYATLSESSGERFQVEIGCLQGGRPCVGRFQWAARECFGSPAVSRFERDGALTFTEIFRTAGGCGARRCEVFIEAGWATYKRVCGRKVVSQGRFDGAVNLNLLNPAADMANFYKAPDADAVAASLPPPPPRLEHRSSEFKQRHGAIPERVQQAARTGYERAVDGADPRDVMDAIIGVDASVWKLDGYIPGSLEAVSIKATDKGSTWRAQYAFSSFQFLNNWRPGWVEIDFEGGRPVCIRYWNNSACSANYEMVVSPQTDRRLPAADQSCITVRTATHTETRSGGCAIWDSRSSSCVMDADPRVTQTEYLEIVNSCKRPIKVVAACMLFRQRFTLPADAVFPSPGFGVMGCTLERG